MISLASHTLRREEGCGHVATIELLTRQKLAVTNEIRAVRRLYPLSWSGNYVTRLFPLSLLLVVRTHNNTDGNKLMIFSSIALYYGDTYIVS